jgi:hypothetical protein
MMDFMGQQVSVHKLGLNETTVEGAYYAKVNGENVGTDGRAFWNTAAEAEACARRYVLAIENTKEQPND